MPRLRPRLACRQVIACMGRYAGAPCRQDHTSLAVLYEQGKLVVQVACCSAGQTALSAAPFGSSLQLAGLLLLDCACQPHCLRPSRLSLPDQVSNLGQLVLCSLCMKASDQDQTKMHGFGAESLPTAFLHKLEPVTLSKWPILSLALRTDAHRPTGPHFLTELVIF